MKTMRSSSWGVLGFSLAVGCGPVVPSSSEGGSTSEGGFTAGGGSTSTGESSGDGVPRPQETSTSAASTSVLPTTEGTFGGTSGSSDSSSGDGFSFLNDTGDCALPDGVYGHCTIETCVIEEQDCPRGESCDAWANDGGAFWNASRCNPVPDEPGQRGDPCSVEASPVTGINTCDAGLICWNVDPEELTGECIDHCNALFECDVATESCSVYNEGYLPLCLPSCSPLEDTCGEGLGCYPNSADAFSCIREGENVHLGGVVHPHCPSGSFMLEGACARFCDVSVEEPCESGGMCEPYYEFGSPPPGLEDVGYCAVREG